MDLGFATSQWQSLQLPSYMEAPFFDSPSDSSSSGASHFSDYLPYSTDLNQFEMSQDRYRSSLLTHASQPTSPFEHRDFTTIIEGDKRRRKSPNTPDLTEKPVREPTPSMQERRRTQNRNSQRALRERRGKYVSDLERELETLSEKHRDLFKSYTRKSDEAAKLTAKIAEITAHLNTLKEHGGPRTFTQISSLDCFESFDAFSACSERVRPDHEIRFCA